MSYTGNLPDFIQKSEFNLNVICHKVAKTQIITKFIQISFFTTEFTEVHRGFSYSLCFSEFSVVGFFLNHIGTIGHISLFLPQSSLRFTEVFLILCVSLSSPW